MRSLPQVPVRFCPSKETLAVLNDRTWIANYSGGKDSTSVVTYVEWLRRIGMVKVESPRLVQSDTEVEYPFLHDVSGRMLDALTASGWQCEMVRPRVNEKLYNRIFGIGNTPVHPGGSRRMRWCTRATKIDPMNRFSRTIGKDVIRLSGVRWNESTSRDGKLKAGGCSAGGECGLPDPGEGVYGPIITWKTCKVIEWLGGDDPDIAATIGDLLPTMRRLVEVYEVKKGTVGLWNEPPKVLSAMRFGCIGCPAITNEKITSSKQGKRHPEWIHLRRIYAVWQALYLRKNRLVRFYPEKVGAARIRYGPLRMEVRKQYFAEMLDIQKQSGVVLVTADDEAFIRGCWDRKVYPRGWSEADELAEAPDEGLFREAAA